MTVARRSRARSATSTRATSSVGENLQGWSPSAVAAGTQTVLQCYQQADEDQLRKALQDRRRPDSRPI